MIGRIFATKRGKAAVAGAIAFALSSGWGAYIASQPDPAAVAIHQAVDKGMIPPAVKLAVDQLITSWEGLRTTAYLDRLPKKPVWTVCYGETLGIKAGMTFTPEQCKAMLITRVIRDYYLPLVDGVKGYATAPVSLQASMVSGAYNYGVDRQLHSRVSRFVTRGEFKQACEAQTAFNKANGRVLPGLVHRREMGDGSRIGEAELCVSGV